MPNISIYTDPIGSQLTSTIGGNEDADKNDFPIFITGDGNFTLTQSDVGLTAGYSIQSFEGSGCSYRAVIRPPETAGVLTVEIAENAVPEMNPAVSQTIRISTSFPDADAVTPTTLFSHGISTPIGIAAAPTGLWILASAQRLHRLSYTGTSLEQSNQLTGQNLLGGDLDYINGDLLSIGPNNTGIVRLRGSNFVRDRFYQFGQVASAGGVIHTRLGIIRCRDNRLQPYDSAETDPSLDVGGESLSSGAAAHQDDFIYSVHSGIISFFLHRINDSDDFELVRRLNVGVPSVTDLTIYGDTLYVLKSTEVQTLDIRPYRPLSKNTKTAIYPQFIKNGETLDLTLLAPDAERFIFDIGFDKPSYLSINATNGLVVASDATTNIQPVLVTVRAINRIDSIPISFYLIIEANTAPVWRDVSDLTMPASSSFDMHLIVDADSVAFESGQAQPTGSSLSNGVFTIATTGGTAYFTATKDGLTTDKEIAIDVIQSPDPDNFSNVFRFRTEIAGVDVSDDLLILPTVQKSLDAIEINRSRADSVSFRLVDDAGKYNPNISGNFWTTNNLNAGGFQEEVKVYLESLVGSTWIESLLFVGVIDEQAESITDIEVEITAIDVSSRLENAITTDFGTLEKWDRLRAQSDEADFEGVYIPEPSLLPMQPETGEAWSDRTELTISRLQLPSEGPPQANTAYMTASDLRTSGGFLQDAPVLNFKTEHKAEDIRFLFSQLGINKQVYNTDVQLPAFTLPNPFVSSRGSVALQTEDTRITRLPSDWVYDSTNNRLLVLMHNPESHIADQLVQYDMPRDNYRVLYTFGRNVKAHRIVRRSATLYYVLTSAGITQDRSASALPRTSDKTGYAYDARAVGSVIRIHRYNATAGTLTEFIPEDDDRPPQLGIHYHAGFENTIYIDEFEGILPAQNSGLVWYDSNLYYRYCNGSEFGVARADTSGVTSEMIDQTDLNYNNHLNFAFDIDTSNGDLFFVYAEGDADESSLIIKKRDSGGTETTVLTDTQDLDAFDDLSGGGAYLGCYEALYHNDNLYMIVPIQRVDEDDSTTPSTYSRSREKSSGVVLYACDVNAGTPELTVIDKWEFFHLSGCNLTVHGGNVHYTEQPIAASIFRAINPDL